MSEYATPRQEARLWHTAREANMSREDVEALCREMFRCNTNVLMKMEMSLLIERIQRKGRQ